MAVVRVVLRATKERSGLICFRVIERVSWVVRAQCPGVLRAGGSPKPTGSQRAAGKGFFMPTGSTSTALSRMRKCRTSALF